MPDPQDSSQETPEDPPPRAETDEDEKTIIRAGLVPDTHEGGYQANLKPARKDLRSFPTQTPPESFKLHHNVDGSVSLEHPAVTIRILAPSYSRTENRGLC